MFFAASGFQQTELSQSKTEMQTNYQTVILITTVPTSV